MKALRTVVKKKPEVNLVCCAECAHAVGQVDNYLIGCGSRAANPHNYKMGLWERQCNFYEVQKKQ